MVGNLLYEIAITYWFLFVALGKNKLERTFYLYHCLFLVFHLGLVIVGSNELPNISSQASASLGLRKILAVALKEKVVGRTRLDG